MFGMSCEFISQYIQAGKRDCPEKIVHELAGSKHEKVRMRVAENEKTPLDILEKLSTDKSADVRIAVATNSSTPFEIVRKLASDEDPNVRLGIAEAPDTSLAILEQLTDDTNPYVSYQARKSLMIARAKELNSRYFSNSVEFRGPDNLLYA